MVWCGGTFRDVVQWLELFRAIQKLRMFLGVPFPSALLLGEGTFSTFSLSEETFLMSLSEGKEGGWVFPSERLQE